MRKNYFFLLVIVCGLVFVSPTVLFAKVMDTRDIELRTESDTDNELRSLLPVRAWIDNRIVYVSFFELPAEATVSVLDTNGRLIDECYIQSPEVISIPVKEREGIFEIVIKCGSNIYIGSFELK